ncbi:MAG TPA: class I SAM-dependent methyltransferase [Thermoanaerobaculia bacterium]|jgi:SAM-dependent methyltransferase
MSGATPSSSTAERPGFWERRRRRRRRIKTSVALRLYSEVFHLDYLHYGLWDGEPLTLEGMRAAQERYAERLARAIPAGVASILDVGCGTGSLSALLKARGYRLEGLSPDPHQQRLYAERVGEPFHLARFQDFVPARTCDLVMMSEVAQYVWLPKLFPAVRRAAPQGYLLLADYFRQRAAGGALPAGSGHPLDDFLDQAERHRCELLEREDVTDAAAPTLELAGKLVDLYVEPAASILADAVASRHPWLFALGRSLLRRRFARLIAGREFLDATTFKKTRRYLLLLFRIRA